MIRFYEYNSKYSMVSANAQTENILRCAVFLLQVRNYVKLDTVTTGGRLVKKIICLLLLGLTAFSFTGCGNKENEALEQYKEEMTAFRENVSGLVETIDSIDPNDESGIGTLLSCLDEMEAEFSKMGNLEVPQQFASVEELADDAAANLSKSVSLYHQAFDQPDAVNPQYADAAREYYSRAFKRVEYIGTILSGELPDDENVTIVTEPKQKEGISDEEEPATEDAAE